MKTSCYKQYKGKNGIGISLSCPNSWKGELYPKLAPSSHLLYSKKSGLIDEIEYEKRYRVETLAKLDPSKVYEELKDNVLLCWEQPVFNNKEKIINEGVGFCHRHIISKWIFENLNIEILEWQPKIKSYTITHLC